MEIYIIETKNAETAATEFRVAHCAQIDVLDWIASETPEELKFAILDIFGDSAVYETGFLAYQQAMSLVRDFGLSETGIVTLDYSKVAV